MSFLTDPTREPRLAPRTDAIDPEILELASRFEKRYAELAPVEEAKQPAADDPFQDVLTDIQPKPEPRVHAEPVMTSALKDDALSLQDATALLRANEKRDAAPAARDLLDSDEDDKPGMPPTAGERSAGAPRTAVYIAIAAAVALVIGLGGGFVAARKVEPGSFATAAGATPAGASQLLRVDYDLRQR